MKSSEVMCVFFEHGSGGLNWCRKTPNQHYGGLYIFIVFVYWCFIVFKTIQKLRKSLICNVKKLRKFCFILILLFVIHFFSRTRIWRITRMFVASPTPPWSGFSLVTDSQLESHAVSTWPIIPQGGQEGGFLESHAVSAWPIIPQGGQEGGYLRRFCSAYNG